jgi:predicted transcriptional regulator
MKKNHKMIRKLIDCYTTQQQVIKLEQWQIAEIKRSVEKADQPNAKFVPHVEVAEWLNTWGTRKERKPPKCR